MTSPTDDEPRPERAPDGAERADEAAVRRLLADARATGPVPPEVAARLDATLTELVAEREAGGRGAADPDDADDAREADAGAAPVVRLSSRRRRAAAAMLVAAAAVVVGGVSVGQYLDRSADDARPAAEGSVDRGGAADEGAGTADESGPGDGPGKPALAPEEGRTVPIDPPRVAPRVRAHRLQGDLGWLQLRKLDGVPRLAYASTTVVAPRGFQCAPAMWGRGILFGVEYDGRAAMAAYREPQGDTQVVEVLQCDTADVLRSTTLRSRLPQR